MKYETIKRYSNTKFRRTTGIKRETFEKMVEILRSKKAELTSNGGPKPKLTVEEMLLSTLEYWREYRTYFHIGASYDISESSIFRIIKWTENIIIQDGKYRLPGKKVLKSDCEYKIIQIDDTETPIERPKKTDNVIKSR